MVVAPARIMTATSSGSRLRNSEPAMRREASTTTISRDEFLEATTDLWEIPPASATRVGHPAPFPVELPHRLIQLYTFEADVVLDPFLGTGATALAAMQDGRGYVGYDVSPEYCAVAEERLEALGG